MSEMYKRLDRKLVRKGAIINIYEDTVQVFNGNIAKWDYIGHNGAAAVIPVLEDGRLLMVSQYRNALDKEIIELPAGGLNGADEPTLDAAKRELEEETGYKSDNLEYLTAINTAVAFCNEKIDIYVARDLVPSKQKFDEDEYLEVKAFTLDELVGMILSGEICDSKTAAGILVYKEKYGL